MNELDSRSQAIDLNLSCSAAVPRRKRRRLGFPGRVLASARQPTTLLQELQQRAWGIACASLALLIGGALVLFSQHASATPEPEISSALNFGRQQPSAMNIFKHWKVILVIHPGVCGWRCLLDR